MKFEVEGIDYDGKCPFCSQELQGRDEEMVTNHIIKCRSENNNNNNNNNWNHSFNVTDNYNFL
jgi:hypothetical protein